LQYITGLAYVFGPTCMSIVISIIVKRHKATFCTLRKV